MAVLAASAVPTRITPLLLQRLDVGDEVRHVRIGELRIAGHRFRLSDGRPALLDRLRDLGIVEILESSPALAPITRRRLQLLAHRAIARAGIAVTFRAALFLVELRTRLCVL